MRVIETRTMASSPEPLVRLQATPSGWVVGDNDMNAVYVRRPGANRFAPSVQALWLAPNRLRALLPGVVAASDKASRCYLGWLAELPDGGAILSCKFGCKEPYLSGIPLDRLDWGSYLVCYNADGTVRWQGRYNAHKGNAQVVADPHVPDRVILVASTGIVWVIDVRNGSVISKTTAPIGNTGEKNSVSIQPRQNQAGIVTLSYVGYSASPSSILRYGIDSRAIPVCRKPPYDTGADEIYCRTAAAYGLPKSVWWAAVVQGQLLYNYVGPRKTAPRWPDTKLPSAGSATLMNRLAPVLFPIAGDKKAVGVVFRQGGVLVAKKLAASNAGAVYLDGNWPALCDREGGCVRLAVARGNDVVGVQIDTMV